MVCYHFCCSLLIWTNLYRFKEQWEEGEVEHKIFANSDNIAFWSVDRKKVKAGLNKLNQCCEVGGLRMNKNKNRDPKGNERQRNKGVLNIHIGGSRKQDAESVKYIGSVLRKKVVQIVTSEIISKNGR